MPPHLFPKPNAAAGPPLYTTLSVLLLLCILAFLSFRLSPQPQTTPSAAALRRLFLSSGDNATVSALLRSLTLRPHLAGTAPSAAAAAIVSAHFRSLRLPSHSLPLQALLSYPSRAALSAHFPNGSVAALPLAEWAPPEHGDRVVAPYHAYSPSGSVRAEVVFVNFGRDSDFRALAALGVNVSGRVAVARKGGGLTRADVVAAAAAHGAAAVLTYAEGNGFRRGFERGTVMGTREGVGDPQSPGWPTGTGAGERLAPEEPEVSRRFPKIPSMPLSFELAEGILGTLGGAPVPLGWKSTMRTMIVGVGPGPTVLDFDYQGENRVETIHNVFAVIRGSEEPDRYVLLGNHRDAWSYGAVDPNSGTAALLDIARRFTLMMRSGWRPRRTIVLCSWDAEEFGMIGSTEWVEQNLLNLRSKAVAYLNVDCAVQGPGFFAGATPQLDNILLEVVQKVNDPDMAGATIYQMWKARNNKNTIERLGRVDSDFAAFLQHGGIPSVDMYYGSDFPVYHTAFDSYEWMKNYGDPTFHRHVAVAGVWGLLALHLADDSILPFNYLPYAEQLKVYEEGLSNVLSGLVTLAPLTSAIQEFSAAAEKAEIEAQKLREQEATSEALILKRRALNDRLMLAERGFLDAEGLQGRRWFKHLIYGPPSDPESKIDFFPGIADAISRSSSMDLKQKKALIQHQIWRVVRAIERATSALRGELT